METNTPGNRLQLLPTHGLLVALTADSKPPTDIQIQRPKDKLCHRQTAAAPLRACWCR
jgi:hypothetical protein